MEKHVVTCRHSDYGGVACIVQRLGGHRESGTLERIHYRSDVIPDSPFVAAKFIRERVANKSQCSG